MTAPEPRVPQDAGVAGRSFFPLTTVRGSALLWTIFGCVVLANNYALSRAFDMPWHWGSLVLSLERGLEWIVLGPAVYRFSQRFRIDRPPYARNLVLHVACFLVMHTLAELVHTGIASGVFAIRGTDIVFVSFFRGSWMNAFLIHFTVFAFVVAMAHAAAQHRETLAAQETLRRREREAARHERRAMALEKQLAQARLATLRAQLNPHFLFNTLETISALVTHDAQNARRTIENLSDLLRHTLDHSEENEAHLGDEVELLEHYLAIQHVRFRDRLAVEIDVPADVQDALVPSLLLQPLVENALKHGIAPYESGGCVRVRAHRCEDDVVIRVSNTGPAGVNGTVRAEGTGLRNAQERLEKLYGSRQAFTYGHLPEGGFEVVLRLPYHTTPPTTPDASWR